MFQALLCRGNPSTHPFITEREKAYLQKEMGQLERDKNLKSTPWKEILTSGPVIACTIDMVRRTNDHLWGAILIYSLFHMQCMNDWVYFIVMIALPKYMNDVLHVSIRQNGFYSSVPWAARLLMAVTSGYVADWLIKSGRLTVTQTRKMYIILGKFASKMLSTRFQTPHVLFSI